MCRYAMRCLYNHNICVFVQIRNKKLSGSPGLHFSQWTHGKVSIHLYCKSPSLASVTVLLAILKTDIIHHTYIPKGVSKDTVPD